MQPDPNSNLVVSRLCELAGLAAQDDSPDALVGIFQSFRPSGDALDGIFDEVEGGAEFERRLRSIYAATQTSQRYDSMTDAYFIVRNPPGMPSASAQSSATQFFDGLVGIVGRYGDDNQRAVFNRTPELRVLEGKAPKKPRKEEDKCELHCALEQWVPDLVLAELIRKNPLAYRLSAACYFIACDSFLRDYLLWPLLGDADRFDPFRPYFELWRHGVKFRAYSNDSLDFYLPRREDGSLIDAGQFRTPPSQ